LVKETKTEDLMINNELVCCNVQIEEKESLHFTDEGSIIPLTVTSNSQNNRKIILLPAKSIKSETCRHTNKINSSGAYYFPCTDDHDKSFV